MDKLEKYVAAWNRDECNCPYCGATSWGDVEFQGEVAVDTVTHKWHCYVCGSDIYAEYRVRNIFVERQIEGETDLLGYPKMREVGVEEWL